MEWADPQIQKWVTGVKVLAKVARKHPQTACAGLVQSLQGKWQCSQRVMPGTEDAFGPLKEAISQIFLPALLKGPAENVTPIQALLALSPGKPAQVSPAHRQRRLRAFSLWSRARATSQRH